MAPAINQEVAMFLPKNLVSALGGLAFGKIAGAVLSRLGAASRLVTVVHYTGKEGAAAIEASGSLRAGSFVALPEEVGTRSAAEVERFLEIGEGKGAMRATFRVPADVLQPPFNGPVTSGGATQFQVSTAIPLAPGSFTPTP